MHVLVGVEGSEESEAALDNVVERAKEAGDEVTVAVFVVDDQRLEDVEGVVRDRMEGTGLEWHVERIEDDHPASSLVERAESGPFDQLAIGGGQLSPMGKIELGPTTEFVLLNARLPVRLER